MPPALQVEQRIDTFLTSYRSSLASMPNAELTVVLEALASQVTPRLRVRLRLRLGIRIRIRIRLGLMMSPTD